MILPELIGWAVVRIFKREKKTMIGCGCVCGFYNERRNFAKYEWRCAKCNRVLRTIWGDLPPRPPLLTRLWNLLRGK